MKSLLIAILMLVLGGCSRKPQVDNPNLLEDNPVRPKRLVEPLAAATNGTNQVR